MADKPWGKVHEHMARRFQTSPQGVASRQTKSPYLIRPNSYWGQLLTRVTNLCTGLQVLIGIYMLYQKRDQRDKYSKGNWTLYTKGSLGIVVRCWAADRKVTGSIPASVMAFQAITHLTKMAVTSKRNDLESWDTYQKKAHEMLFLTTYCKTGFD